MSASMKWRYLGCLQLLSKTVAAMAEMEVSPQEEMANPQGMKVFLRQPAHLHTQAESGAYLRDFSRVPRRRPFMKPPYAIGSVTSLSGHAIAYRWRSLPRVRRHKVSKPQGSSEWVLPWQITMDQLIFASLSHTHYYCRKRRDLAWTTKTLSKIYCHKRGINLSRRFICSVYHVLRKCTRRDNGVCLNRAGPGAMGHMRCLKGYDRASKLYSEKQRGTVQGSETISLVSCHMAYNPP